MPRIIHEGGRLEFVADIDTTSESLQDLAAKIKKNKLTRLFVNLEGLISPVVQVDALLEALAQSKTLVTVFFSSVDVGGPEFLAKLHRILANNPNLQSLSFPNFKPPVNFESLIGQEAGAFQAGINETHDFYREAEEAVKRYPKLKSCNLGGHEMSAVETSAKTSVKAVLFPPQQNQEPMPASSAAPAPGND